MRFVISLYFENFKNLGNEKMIEFACHKTANAPKPFKCLVAKNFIKLEVLFLFKAYFE